jgi:hypothetical protein
VLHPGPGKVLKVVEHDGTGRVLDETIESEYVRTTYLQFKENRGALSWIVSGDGRPYRNFYIYTIEKKGPPPGTPRMLISTSHFSVPPGQVLVSDVKHKYGILEVNMTVPYSKKNECWVGFKNELPRYWTHRKFDPDKAQDLLTWYFKVGSDQHPLVAMFDNGSGMVEVSSGKKLEIEGLGTLDCDQVWGDFCWTEGNDRLDTITYSAGHTYRIEWQRVYQRWYIDGRLMYERRIALDEPLPLRIENHTKQQNIEVGWVDASSPYCRKQR